MSDLRTKESVFITLLLGSERQHWANPALLTFCMHMARLQERGQRKIVVEYVMGRVPHDSARNCGADRFLKNDCAWWLCIDNDMLVHANILDMIDSAPPVADVLIPRYFSNLNVGAEQKQLAVALVWAARPENPPCSSEWCELEAAGTGVIAIRRRVFDRIGKPFFRFGYDANGITNLGEDEYFCKQVKAAGMKIFGSNRHEAGHAHTFDMSLVARLAGCAGPLFEPSPSATPPNSMHMMNGAFFTFQPTQRPR